LKPNLCELKSKTSKIIFKVETSKIEDIKVILKLDFPSGGTSKSDIVGNENPL